jgi:hypothetical protein
MGFSVGIGVFLGLYGVPLGFLGGWVWKGGLRVWCSSPFVGKSVVWVLLGTQFAQQLLCQVPVMCSVFVVIRLMRKDHSKTSVQLWGWSTL